MSISYFRGDERPPWEAAVTLNGNSDDLSSGFTFTVRVAPADGSGTVLEKTSGAVGYADGVVQVNWFPDELDLPDGLYTVQLICRRTSDGAEWTVGEDLIIRPRLSAP